MTTRRLVVTLLRGSYAICRLAPGEALPGWATAPGSSDARFLSITRTNDEMSIVCDEDAVPPGCRSERGWRCFKVQGPFAFTEVGILASLASALAQQAISIFVVSTYDTDYLLVKAETLEQAAGVLAKAGHQVAPER